MLLLAGGIGTTPALSMFRELAASAQSSDAVDRVHLVWSVRSASMLSLFAAELQRLASPSFEVTCFVTGGGGGPDHGAQQQPADVKHGRPNIPSLVASAASAATATAARPSNLLVFACGPTPLVSAARDAAVATGAAFHSETFEL